MLFINHILLVFCSSPHKKLAFAVKGLLVLNQLPGRASLGFLTIVYSCEEDESENVNNPAQRYIEI
ncbi:hypothetical protein CASFOL_028031 [Castilleja foliolosa]|uniref:Uncharacterized protein n=1 Tax=Castilleja foliolosa TaxID=1961234 RepID=A0ABD3CGI1_9LAMI